MTNFAITEIETTMGGKIDTRIELPQPSAFDLVLAEMQQLHENKNADYGDSFAKSVEKYGLISALTRISDKFNRAEQLILGNDARVKDEKLRDTLIDMASYCVMTIMELDKQASNG